MTGKPPEPWWKTVVACVATIAVLAGTTLIHFLVFRELRADNCQGFWEPHRDAITWPNYCYFSVSDPVAYAGLVGMLLLLAAGVFAGIVIEVKKIVRGKSRQWGALVVLVMIDVALGWAWAYCLLSTRAF